MKRSNLVSITSLSIIFGILTISLHFSYQYLLEKNSLETKNIEVPCVSYSPHDIFQKKISNVEEIEKDLLKIKKISNCVRIYSSTSGFYHVPMIAKKLDMKVVAGAWLDDGTVKNGLKIIPKNSKELSEKNEKEIHNLIELAQTYDNILYVVVGNETILESRVSKEYLIESLIKVKKSVSQPITTGEPWSTWTDNTDLEKYVDFVGVHIFPFWTRNSIEESATYLENSFLSISSSFSKPVKILETGWPSNGPSFGDAIPSVVNQREYIQKFKNITKENGYSFFNVVDGLDIPSKISTHEGIIGIHWGLLNQDGTTKRLGTVKNTVLYTILYIFSIGLWVYYFRNLYKKVYLKKIKYIFISTFMLGGLLFSFVSFSVGHLYDETGGFQTIAYIVLYYIAISEIVLLVIFFITSKYILKGEALLDNDLKNNRLDKYIDSIKDEKFCAIVAAKNEDPSQVVLCLKSLLDAGMDQIIYLDNNSKDDNSFKTLQKVDMLKDNRLTLLYKDNVEGNKAGAVNLASQYVKQDITQIILVDSDYVVRPDWVEDIRFRLWKHKATNTSEYPLFIQYPQSYIVSKKSNTFEKISAYLQYLLFYSVYPARAVLGHVIMNGTMVVIPKKYFTINLFPTYSICEDAAFVLQNENIFEKEKITSIYVAKTFGQGIAVKTFKSYMVQRFRWVYGTMQIIRKYIFDFIKKRKIPSATYMQYLIDWRIWLMIATYPLFLFFSIFLTYQLIFNYFFFIVHWTMIFGLICLICIPIIIYFLSARDFKRENGVTINFFSLVLLEASLIIVIIQAVWQSFFENKKTKAVFQTTRGIEKKIYTKISLYFLIFILSFMCLMLTTVLIMYTLNDIQWTETKIYSIFQNIVMIIPLMGYVYYYLYDFDK